MSRSTTPSDTTTTFRTYGEHIAEGQRGTLIMFERPEAEELAMLVLPYTFCPNVADHLDESNWSVIQAALLAADPDGNDHHVASFGHWATPYDLMLVRAGSTAHVAAEAIMDRYEQYSVLDEDDFSQREHNAFHADLSSALAGLTIVVDGAETAEGEPLYDKLHRAISDILTERDSPDNCDVTDVERVLRDELGFMYDESELTWAGSLPA
jgi:hypothetical protein